MGWTNPPSGKSSSLGAVSPGAVAPQPTPTTLAPGGIGPTYLNNMIPMNPMAPMINSLLNPGKPQVSPEVPTLPTTGNYTPPQQILPAAPSPGIDQSQPNVGVGPGGETNTNQNVPGGQVPTPPIPSSGWLQQRPPASSPYTPPAGLGQRMPFMNRRWGANA